MVFFPLFILLNFKINMSLVENISDFQKIEFYIIILQSRGFIFPLSKTSSNTNVAGFEPRLAGQIIC